MTHAFFKALLFLGAGGVIYAAHHEHDMFRLGGLRHSLPVVYWTFLIGSASLAALPLVTAGFYSKDLILWQAWAGTHGDARLWAAGVIGALLTALYTFRMVFVTFHGAAQKEIERRPGGRMRTALIVLAALSVVGGLVETPHSLGHVTLFSDFLSGVLPATVLAQESVTQELLLQLLTIALAAAGIAAAWYFYLRNTTLLARMTDGPLATGLKRFLFSGWGFDAMYDVIFVRPLVGLARVNRQDFIDLIYESIASVTRSAHRALSVLQTGKLRHYALGILIGTLVTLTLVVLL